MSSMYPIVTEVEIFKLYFYIKLHVAYSYPNPLPIISSVESQKGIITFQLCSIENQKGAITVQSLWW